MDSPAETLAWPPWLEDETTNRGRLRKIMAAVHRCYMEHPDGASVVPTGPHMTISMAENFIAQMLGTGSARTDVQYFTASGTWVRPPGAVRVDYLIHAAGGGGTVGVGEMGRDGSDGALHSGSLDPDQLPERVEVTIGQGGRGAQHGHVKAGDGAAGYALFLTHLATEAPERP